jgi:alpha-tubulin suppressor-like RCC1 family protein
MQHTPKQIPSSLFSKHKIVSVALGKHHAVAMTSEHDIYTWGRTGPWLGLGDSPADDVHVPRKIEGGFAESKVVRIGAGNQMSAAVSGAFFLLVLWSLQSN